MNPSIFMIDGAGTLVAMKPMPFAREDDFQRLLEQYPELLIGDQIEPNAPRRWLLIRREMGVPGSIDAPTGWSLDHLFLDQDGVPTLVEVKRAENTELRRRVVAQMLDYAANAVVYWPVDELRSRFEERLNAEGRDPDDELFTRLDITSDQVEAFWQRVSTNLRSGKIRMLFVADQIPRELRRIVEFLNEQMSPAVVLALELRQFSAQADGLGTRTLVPVVFGQTERAAQEKRDSQSKSSAGGNSISQVKSHRGRWRNAIDEAKARGESNFTYNGREYSIADGEQKVAEYDGRIAALEGDATHAEERRMG